MTVFIEPGKNFTGCVNYAWSVFAFNKRIPFYFIDHKQDADIVIDSTDTSDFPVALWFYDALERDIYGHEHFFTSACWITDAEDKKDYLATSFYMLNSIQEYGASQRDEIGRFRFEASYQSKYGCVTENLVQKCFDSIVEEYPKLSAYSSYKRQSRFFLSHDIDSIHGAVLQDSFYLLKNFKPQHIFPLLVNAVLQRPDWFNMDKIMKIEDEHSFKSTFFWIVNKGRINKREVNADYDVKHRSVQSTINTISNKGWENGLHKSISVDTMQQEMDKSGFFPVANRNHYLKFTLPELYEQVEQAGLQMDASLGFAERYGFRNSYGLPFIPFHLKQKKKFSFVEVPLNMMDGTFQSYMKVPREDTLQLMIDFFEKNKYNCLLSVLWHNTHFTNYKYKGYLAVYKQLLSYLFENKFECINTSQIIKEYLHGGDDRIMQGI